MMIKFHSTNVRVYGIQNPACSGNELLAIFRLFKGKVKRHYDV
jgi:hypothetical protein